MLKIIPLSLLVTAMATTLLPAQQEVNIRVNVSEDEGPFRPVWAWVGHDEPNYTYSQEGRNLLTTLSRLSPYPFHDRTHNLLTSGDGTPALKWGSTNAYSLDRSGQPIYNWTIIDKIFDTYQAAGIMPFVEIGFMPEALSTHPEPYRHRWPKGPLYTGWSYPPKDYKMWADLVYHWVRHIANRYGAKEVEGWEWEVWNEPNIGYWHATLDEYCRLYDFTAGAVKRALPGARVGGPGTTGPGNEEARQFLRGFLEHCLNGENYATGKAGSPLDFISFHAKGRTRFVDGHVHMDIGSNLRDIDQGFGVIQQLPALSGLPVILSESDPEGCAACDATSHPENGYRLTSQYASYEAELLDRTLALAARHHINLQGAITWAFTFPGQPLFAGYRALTTNNFDLPLLNLFRMLGQMGGEHVAAESTGALSLDNIVQTSIRTAPDVNAMATRKGRKASVLVWNYDDNASPLPPAGISLTVEGLPPGISRILVRNFRVDTHYSNSYTAWQTLGSPLHPSPAQSQRIKAAGKLQLLGPPRWVSATGHKVHLDFTEPSEAVSLVELTW